MVRAGRGVCDARSSELARQAASLDALSPLKVLARGYAIAYREDAVATNAAAFVPGDTIAVRFADGTVTGTVDTVAADAR